MAATPAEAPAGAGARTPVRLWNDGWYARARRVDSPNFGPRPPGTAVSLVVLHSISLPPGRYGGDEVENLFTNRLDHDAHPYFAGLRGLEVSAHFFVRRDGKLHQYVSCEQRAWHAGRSSWRGRENCNDYSIGIELEGLEGLRFTAAQYRRLAALLRGIAARFPIDAVVGHEHVAPGRKADPGPGFEWPRLARLTRRPGMLSIGEGPEKTLAIVACDRRSPQI